jgi:hypothetical protein
MGKIPRTGSSVAWTGRPADMGCFTTIQLHLTECVLLIIAKT